jgi:uncharacterized surface protein with fasciclin (FAS1) repeats
LKLFSQVLSKNPVYRRKEILMLRRSIITLSSVLGLAIAVAIPQVLFTPARAQAAAAAPAPKDIVDTAVAAGSFNTLAAALKAAGLVDTLKGAGPFTVFAPTDEAFAKLPAGTVESLLKPENKEKLIAVLTYHVVPAKALAADVKDGASYKTVQGKELKATVKDGKVTIGGANVVKADVIASNGVIHVIDAVLLP